MNVLDDPAMQFMAALVTEVGPSWGQIASKEQIADASAILDPDATVRRHWLGRSRGYSKTTDVAAMTLAAMATGLVRDGGRGYVCAADADQAGLLVDACRGFVQRTSYLSDVFTIDRRRITGPNHTQIIVLASDASSA